MIEGAFEFLRGDVIVHSGQVTLALATQDSRADLLEAAKLAVDQFNIARREDPTLWADRLNLFGHSLVLEFTPEGFRITGLIEPPAAG